VHEIQDDVNIAPDTKKNLKRYFSSLSSFFLCIKCNIINEGHFDDWIIDSVVIIEVFLENIKIQRKKSIVIYAQQLSTHKKKRRFFGKVVGFEFFFHHQNFTYHVNYSETTKQKTLYHLSVLNNI
jgi:hypothetical protein